MIRNMTGTKIITVAATAALGCAGAAIAGPFPTATPATLAGTAAFAVLPFFAAPSNFP
jgi:hypothetical protein